LTGEPVLLPEPVVCVRSWPVVVSPVPVECREGWDPLGAGRDEPDEPVVGCGVGALEVVDVLEVVGGGELRVGAGTLTDGTLTEGVLTDGTLTDGTLTEGVLTEGSGDDKELAGGTAIAVIAPNTPAATNAASNFLPLDTG
jgi:hypothetical protein